MTLASAQKAVVALVVAAIAIASYWIAFDPEFQQIATLLVAQVFAVIGVFATTNHTAEDAQKAVTAAAGSALSLVAVFTTVDPNTGQYIGAVILALAQVYGVWRAQNAPSPVITTVR